MQYCISEGEAQYMDANQGHFSKKLAEWAISRMMTKDPATGRMVKAPYHPIEEMENAMHAIGTRVSDECIYDAWYLYNMCFADYRNSLDDERRIARYIDETINDPDGCPEMVLACFRAKMDVLGIPIFWERMM